MTARRRLAAGTVAAALGVLAAVGLAACGSGGSSTTSLAGPFTITTGPGASTSTTSTGSPTPSTTTASHTTPKAPHPAAAPRTHKPAATAPPKRPARSAARSHSQGGRAKPPSPSVPSGLVATAGYGTYELCQGTCTGSVPAALRRPLQIPAGDGGPCPITLRAAGPVSPNPGTPLGVSAFVGSDWMGAQVTWTAAGSYAGPVLIRGRQVGGSGGAVGFGEGHTPYGELQLLDAGAHSSRVPGGGRAWLTYTRVPAPGCYGYQVDGTSFTEVFVFRAA